MRRRAPFALACSILALLLAACAPAAPAPAQPAPAPAQPAAKAADPAASADPLDEIIAAANQEGQLHLYWTTTGTDEWRNRFQDAFNRHYGTQVTFRDTRGGDWTGDTTKLVAEAAAGQSPTFDVMLTTEAHQNDLFVAGLLGEYDWVGLFGVYPDAVMFNGGGFMFAHQVALPAYNSTLVSEADVPTAWDDLLDPKWKDKLGVGSATHHWGRLSQEWGDERTTQFVEQLAAQNPRLGRLAELNQALQIGEIQMMTTQVDNLLQAAQAAGAPVAYADQVSPVLLQSMVASPIQGGPNPNVALLFAGFLATPEAHQLYHEFQKQSSIFMEGSEYWELVQGKEVVLLREEFMAADFEERTQKYGTILGYR